MDRVVIKIGTNLLTNENHTLNRDFLEKMVEEIAKLQQKGCQCIIVTSGAVASGRSCITLKKETKNIPYRQILASVGQGILMHEYFGLFQKYKINVAQILLTEIDFREKESFLNTRNIINRLLELKIIPIVNENDVTAYKEIQFGDNDNLSAKLAAMIDADMLILLTNVNGLYTDNPEKNPQAKFITKVEEITDEIKKMAKGKESKHSLGGMLSKLEAAKYATMFGIDTYIAPGHAKNVLTNILINASRRNSIIKLGTFFPAQASKKDGKKKWMQAQIIKGASIKIDSGAVNALLKRGSSLLPSGILEVKGNFKRGDIVQVYDHECKTIGFGIVNYSSKEIDIIKGVHSKEVEKLLEAAIEPEVIHRDNLAVL